MRTAIRGTLRWLSAEEGGRRQPFAGLRYATVARFPGHDTTWSVVVEFTSIPVAGEPMTVSFRFLSPDAPVELLQPGSRFELIEGERVVAVGEVLFNDETGSVHLNNQRFPE